MVLIIIMKKRIPALLLFLCLSTIYAQNDTVIPQRKVAYMDVKSYRYHKMNVNGAIDSIGFRIIQNDTIITVSGYETKGVKVPYEEKDSIFLERYKEIVYNKKYQNKTQKILPTMKTWKNEIKIYFDKSVNRQTIKKFVEFTKYLDQEVDSLKITLVKDKEKSNYFIYGMKNTSDVNLDPRISEREGYYLEWNNKQNIYSCSLKLNIQNPLSKEQIITSLKMNFIRSLGYFYLQRNYLDCTSYFSSCSSDKKEFGKNDLEILKYHYSYGICKGTDLIVFEKNHKDAKEILKKGNSKIEFIHN